jgi:hypothetical protein
MGNRGLYAQVPEQERLLLKPRKDFLIGDPSTRNQLIQVEVDVE